METILNKNAEGYGYKYTDLSQIHQYLEMNKMSYYQYIDRIDNDDYIMTVKIIDGKELAPLRGCRVVNATLSGIKNPAQEQGSALTYARRYSLLMAFGLATDDDDAASLTERKEPTLEDAKNYIVNFGKYSGEHLETIIQDDEWYKNYLLGGNDEYIKKCIMLLCPEEAKIQEELKEHTNLMAEFTKLVSETGTDIEKIRKNYKVDDTAKLTQEQLQEAIELLKKKLK